MKILIPDHYIKDVQMIRKIKAVSQQAMISRLNIESNYGLFLRVARGLRKVMPRVYGKWEHLFDNHE